MPLYKSIHRLCQHAAHFKVGTFLTALFLIGVVHRGSQWYLLGPQVRHLAMLNPNYYVIQLLSPDIWRRHFAHALLHLQQAPPLPNLIYGTVAILTKNATTRAGILILWSGLLSCIASVLLALLLIRLNMPKILAFFVSVVFLCSGDILVNEYSAFGQLFYEQLSMVELLCAALSAISLARCPSIRVACGLGTSVAALALTRSTFSYVEIPILAWSVWILRSKNDRRLIYFYLLPVLVLHGGWAAKQLLVQKDWQWATSSWGGANIQAGELKRKYTLLSQNISLNMIETLNTSEYERQIPCLKRWEYLLEQQPRFGIFNLAIESDHYVGKEFGPSLTASAIDAISADDRDSRTPLDSSAFRELSGCVQNAYVHYWLDNPWHAIKNWWQSYGVFWSPIDSFTEIYPSVLIPRKSIWKDLNRTPIWSPQGELFERKHYYIRNDGFLIYLKYDDSKLEPATVLALPFLPSVLALIGMLFIHLSPVLGSAILVLNKNIKPIRAGRPPGYGCLILLYIYLAGVSNLVEYGENMRFRLAAEPLIWAIALASAYSGIKLLQDTYTAINEAHRAV